VAHGSRCEFCRSLDAPTREHVIPRWLSAALIDAATAAELPSAAYGELTTADEDDRGYPWKTARVCVSCNGGWMKQLEDAVIPILRPMATEIRGPRQKARAQTLDRQRQELLARWAYKTNLTAELQLRKELGLVIPRSEYQRFQSEQLPKRCEIWIGRYAPPVDRWPAHSLARLGRMTFQIPIRTLAPGRLTFVEQMLSPKALGYCSTIQVGSVVFHLVGHFSDTVVTNKPAVDGTLLQLFPISQADVSWPPRMAFTGEEVDLILTKPVGGAFQVDPSLTVSSSGRVLQKGTGEAVHVDLKRLRNRPKARARRSSPGT
jgi:hypothetical protein